ncbi:MAG: metallophosphoesterase [Minicystis sp.]
MEEVLFAWVHLSDIHVGHGDKSHGWDQELVLDRLIEDFAPAQSLGAPKPDALLVTGDIAFSGAGRAADEYERARKRLLAAAAAVGLTADRIFTVPGNHDVNRAVDKTPFVSAFVESLRKGDESLDGALADDASRKLLASRMAKYLELSAGVAPACLQSAIDADQRLFWVHTLDARGGLRVRIAGLNTAILSRDDTDAGKLRLGKEQLARALRPSAGDGEVIIVLTHHPLHGWLADGDDANKWLREGAHLHLFGHVHEQEIEETRHGTGSRFVRVTAGAAHGDDWPKGAPAHHGYNFAAIVRDAAGKLHVRLWPRAWSDKAKRFRVDADAVGDGEKSTTQELGLTVGAPTKPTGSGDVPAAVATFRSESTAGAGGQVSPPPTISPAQPEAPVTPTEVFVFYAPEDDDLRKKLDSHLAGLRRRGAIESYDAYSIKAGADHARALAARIESARVFLVLVSASFIDSEFFEGPAFKRALERAQRGEALLIPVYLRPCDWKSTVLERFQGVPRFGEAITSKRDIDAAMLEVATELKPIVMKPKK